MYHVVGLITAAAVTGAGSGHVSSMAARLPASTMTYLLRSFIPWPSSPLPSGHAPLSLSRPLGDSLLRNVAEWRAGRLLVSWSAWVEAERLRMSWVSTTLGYTLKSVMIRDLSVCAGMEPVNVLGTIVYRCMRLEKVSWPNQLKAMWWLQMWKRTDWRLARIAEYCSIVLMHGVYLPSEDVYITNRWLNERLQ